MKRGGNLKRSAMKPGKRRTTSPEDRERWWSTWTGVCVACGAAAQDRHHVVYRQHVKAKGGDEFDPANAMDLCRSCHDAHHGGVYLSTDLWLGCNWLFAFNLMGEATHDYVRRYYVHEAREEAA